MEGSLQIMKSGVDRDKSLAIVCLNTLPNKRIVVSSRSFPSCQKELHDPPKMRKAIWHRRTPSQTRAGRLARLPRPPGTPGWAIIPAGCVAAALPS